MKSFRAWAAALMVTAAGVSLSACGDAIQSPDFTSVTTLESIELRPGTNQALPAGTQLQISAVATYSRTLPPGTRDANGNEISEERFEENVTGRASWTSSAEAVATVERGLITARAASATPATITASFEGRSDAFDLTVTDATLQAVEFIKPTGIDRNGSNTYDVATGNTLTFEIYGRFSDNQTRQLSPSAYSMTWTSSAPGTLTNTGGSTFQGQGAGSATVTGGVNGTGANPSSATATVNVLPLNAFCQQQFLAALGADTATASSAFCINCSVDNEEAIIDGNENSFAVMSIPLGLLTQSNVSVTVFDAATPRMVVGQQAGFVISRDIAPLVSAELVSGLQVETMDCNAAGACTVVETFDAESGSLTGSALGQSLDGDETEFLLATAALTQPADGLRLTFDGGLVSALATANVHAACAVLTPPAP